MADWTDKGIQRRIISHSGFRLDGLADLFPRCQGASIFDVGCNRGHVSHDLMYYGATTLHGCDSSKEAIRHANELFADYRHVSARFEVVDLTGGPHAIKAAFGQDYRKQYDFVLMLAVYHKLRRDMPTNDLLFLVDHLAHHTGRLFVWRGSENELAEFEPVLLQRNFARVHYSRLCEIKLPQFTDPVPQPCAIWAAPHATTER